MSWVSNNDQGRRHEIPTTGSFNFCHDFCPKIFMLYSVTIALRVCVVYFLFSSLSESVQVCVWKRSAGIYRRSSETFNRIPEMKRLCWSIHMSNFSQVISSESQKIRNLGKRKWLWVEIRFVFFKKGKKYSGLYSLLFLIHTVMRTSTAEKQQFLRTNPSITTLILYTSATTISEALKQNNHFMFILSYGCKPRSQKYDETQTIVSWVQPPSKPAATETYLHCSALDANGVSRQRRTKANDKEVCWRRSLFLLFMTL